MQPEIFQTLPIVAAALAFGVLLTVLAHEQRYRGAAIWWAVANYFYAAALIFGFLARPERVDWAVILGGLFTVQVPIFVLLGTLLPPRRIKALAWIGAGLGVTVLALGLAVWVDPRAALLIFGFNAGVLLLAAVIILRDRQPGEGAYHGLIAGLLVVRSGCAVWLGVDYVQGGIAALTHEVSSLLIVLTGAFLILLEHRRACRRLEVTALERDEARCAAETSNLEKTAMLTGMSHELRTPLNAILGYAEAARFLPEPAFQSKARDYLSDIRAAALGLKAMVDQLLRVSELEAGRHQLDLQPVSLSAVAMCAARSIGAEGMVRPEPELWVRADPELLAHAVETMLQVLKAYLPPDKVAPDNVTERGFQIEPELDGSGSRLRLRVRMDPGLADQPGLGHILDRHYTGQVASAATRSGLSLSIARHLLTLMGGSLESAGEHEVVLSFHRADPVPAAGKPLAAE